MVLNPKDVLGLRSQGGHLLPPLFSSSTSSHDSTTGPVARPPSSFSSSQRQPQRRRHPHILPPSPHNATAGETGPFLFLLLATLQPDRPHDAAISARHCSSSLQCRSSTSPLLAGAASKPPFSSPMVAYNTSHQPSSWWSVPNPPHGVHPKLSRHSIYTIMHAQS
ncbi:uncharacterized protein LOC122019282 [Zingiber officinale]|uniref:uncharacterized protein LOC122019282 n=1 Tax=Zingiber officinale TaxID=94328 RepID=UPI001C4B890A|nr:uncharacterized protein LOC122019282 [Zingiber officinale]